MIGAVLAGGAGRRMGGGKPAMPLGGRPLIAWALEAVRRAGLEPVVVAKADTALPALSVPVIHDAAAVRHPLAGVLAALEQAGGEPVVVVGADMPFVTPAIIAALAGAAAGRPAVATSGDRIHPLCARYVPDGALPAALAAEAPLRATLAALDPVLIAAPPEALFNVNSPQDLAAAEARLAEASR